MLARALFAAVLIFGLSGASPAQNDVTASFYGRVFVDGRPLERTIEIRLEREDGVLVATSFTHNSYEFSFNFVQIRPGSRYSLVIRDLNYKELRYQFDLDDLLRDPLTGSYSAKKAFLLQLESTQTSDSKITGSKTFDVRQILPAEAQKEYDAAIEELKRGDNKSAMKRLQDVLQLAPHHIDTLNILGAEYLKIGNYDRAEQLLLKAHELKSNDAINLANLGVVYFQKGEKFALSSDAAQQKEAVQLHQKAVQYLQQALHLDSKSQRAMYYLGTALYGLGDYRKAESLLIKALARDDPMPEAHLTLINLYVKQKRYDAAIEQIEAFLKINPDASIKEQLEKTIQQIKKEKSTK